MEYCSKSALNSAADRGHLPIVKYLLNNGAHIETPNKDGFSPLAQAVYEGQLEVVEYLLSHGANPMVQGKDGRTLLDLAKDPFDRKNQARILNLVERAIAISTLLVF